MKLYVIQTGSWDDGVVGYLMNEAGKELHSHMSSNMDWLVRDLTKNFGREAELAGDYPEHEIVVVKGTDPLPAEIEHFFDKAESESEINPVGPPKE